MKGMEAIHQSTLKMKKNKNLNINTTFLVLWMNQ